MPPIVDLVFYEIMKWFPFFDYGSFLEKKVDFFEKFEKAPTTAISISSEFWNGFFVFFY